MKRNNLEIEQRALLTKAKRVVVKIGTHVLVDKNGRPNRRRIEAIVKQLVALEKNNYEIIIVSSGAIGAGLQVLNMKKRPTALCDLQMVAAVGQMRLLNYYHEFFHKAHCQISQVLLTHADLKDRKRHLNARNTLLNLLRHKVIPIINENDVVADDEIKIGDNDVLSSLVAVLMDADLLIMLTSPNGLRKPIAGNKTKRISYLENVDKAALQLVIGKHNVLSMGGMASKLQAAQTAAKIGSLVVIASGLQKDVIKKIIQGDDIGTLIGNKNAAIMLRKRKRWISYFHRSQGKIIIDRGAEIALKEKGSSLLPIGIKKITGQFPIGALIDIVNQKNDIIGNGLTEYTSDEIVKIKGKRSADIAAVLGYKNNNAVIHRDNLSLL
jgi:glutamate 5-kinase